MGNVVEELLSPGLRRERARQEACIHRWSVESPRGLTVLWGICVKCDAYRTFDAVLPEPTQKERISALRLHRRDTSEHRGYEVAALKLAQEGF